MGVFIDSLNDHMRVTAIHHVCSEPFHSAAEAHSESQVLEGKGGGSSWPGASERRGGMFAGQHPRPRAFSQSAVHTLEQRERQRDLVKV